MKELYDLTNPQKSIWVTEEFYKGTSIENIAGEALILQEVNFDKLREAINIFFKTNDSFRLKFIKDNGNIKQYFDDFSPFSFEMVNLSTDKDLKKLEEELSKTPLEALNSYMFNLKLFKFEDGHGGFIIVMHHLVTDAWGAGLLVSRIIDIYDALLSNNFALENFINPSYTEYIESEQKYMTSKKFEKDKAFWNNIFKTIPETATIPGSISGNNMETKAKRKLFKIPSETMNFINSFCKENKISPFNFFMGIYGVYLSRVSNLDEFVIGTPILNRSNVKEKHTVGMFISVVPFKLKLNHEDSFANFSTGISADFFNIFRHQKYPYQMLLEDLRNRNSSIPNLYNVVLSYQNMRNNSQSTHTDYEAKWLFNGNIADDMEIHFFDINDTGVINIAYDYKTSKYTSDDIYSLHSRILHMINQIIEKNDISLKEIEIITPDEKNKILNEFNNTKLEYPGDKTIVELFEEQVEKNPDAIAVVFEDQKLTYKALNEKANSLAHYLVKNGAIPNDIIAIFLDKGLEIPITMLGILKAHCAFLPIDIDYPTDRINFMISNSNAKFICSSNDYKEKFDEKFVNVSLSNKKLYTPCKYLKKPISPNDLMYIIYTSGSTGKPKGVLVTHKNIVRLVTNQNFITYSASENMVQTGTIAFDACIFEIFAPLLHGFKLFIIKKDMLLNPNLFEEFLLKNEISILFLTTGLFNKLGNLNPNIFRNLKYLLTGGDVIAQTAVSNILKYNKNIQIVNCYGPTENGSYSTCFNVPVNWNMPYIPIGKPIANSTAYIVSKDGNLLPEGCKGELWVGGDGISKGYINQPNLTKEKFIKSPFSKEVVYKTGDLVQYDKLGNICFLGRIDNQVKVRGYRIELGEIDNVIVKFKNIKESFSTVKTTNGTARIYSYILSDEKIDINKLKTHMSSSLPHYMIPFEILQLDAFPLNFNGKIDIPKLPTPDKSQEIILPRNDIDTKLISILVDLLNVDNISITDSFFEIGGDSLSAINFCSQIQSEFNVQLFVKDILEHPNIQEISDIISKNSYSEKQTSIVSVNKKDSYPVSSAQKRMYFVSTMAGENSTLYNVPGAIILEGSFDIDKLEKCFNTLISRHESLRTYFAFENDNVVQKISEKVNFKLDVQDDAHFDNLNNLFEEFVKPFNLKKAPLFRAKFIKFSSKKSALFVDFHHIISDGTSLAIFIDELCKLYNDETLPELKITYKDFAVFENNNLVSGKLQEAENYWINQFKDDIPVLNLPTNYSRPATQSYEGSKIFASIDLETKKKIDTLSKTLGVTPYMLLLSAYYILLSKYTSQEDIVVGSPIVGRDLSETYNIIGMFVNTLALRCNVKSNQTFKDFLETVKANCVNAYKYQTYPFDELVNKLNIKRDSSRNPLFDTMFIYQNNGLKNVQFNNVKSEYYLPDTNISKFDLSIELIPNESGISVSFEYATKLFKEDFIKNLSNHYLNILNIILENKDINLSDICMLSEDEKNKILNKFNDTCLDYPKDLTIVELFEEQVEKNPDKIAVVFENEKLTYRELNAKANALAHHIHSSGITKNSTIGILLNRSIEMIISIVGVLKAGCTYVLIDHTFPENRVNYILENSNAKLLITDNTYTTNCKNICRIDQFEFKTNIKNLPIVNTAEDSFALIYTSGSTGNPKGVVLKHAGLVNLVYNYFKENIFLGKPKKVLGSAAVSFDMFAVELFTSILLGGTLYLLNEDEHKNPVKMAEIIINNNVNFSVTTPTKIELLLSNPNTKKCLSVLDTIQLGGEVFTSSLYEKLRAVTNANISNGYGPTEITACCSCKNILSAENINIGKPIPNMKIYILDKDGNLCPIGVPGELCISGIGLAQGYINDDEKTQKAFVTSKINNERIYKTGDIALFNNNGEIKYVGRNDFQVKINGLRIELSEIEKQLLSIKEIQNCAVLSDTKKTYLKAFIVAKDELSIPAIRKALLEKLPTYMVPKYIIQIDNIPLTSNGKVDRKILNSYEFSLSNEETDYVAPETDLQSTFCEIWTEILQTKIGIDNDLFELGADSLSAIRFKVEALNKGIDVPYSDIFKYKTIRKLSTSKTEEIVTTPIEDFDYDSINKLLKKNKIKSNYSIKKSTNNNVLLFGSNGFVGMHIIKSFIENDTGIIYCIMRDKNGKGALNRFLDILHFYFGDTLDSFIGNRIIVLRGDIIKPNFGLSERSYNTAINNVSTIINAAANVKHFGDFDKFKSINIDATKQTIEFCRKYNKRLIHLSTLSISGNMFLDDTISRNKLQNSKKIYFSERNLFINQSLDNVYTRSKFEAEKIVLESISKENLDALVLRLGNITSRASDGTFQINPENNAFTGRLKAFVSLGVIPKSLLTQKVEFTPVDLCADSIIKCLQNKVKNISVLHIYNRNHSRVDLILKEFNNIGFKVKPLPDDKFSEFIKNNLNNSNIKDDIKGIVNDLSVDKKISYKTNTYIKSDFSINFLLRCKFKWGKIRKDYLNKYINYLKSINFFD